MDKMRIKKKTAPFFIILAGCMWGCMRLLVRPLNAIGLATMEIVALRSWVTAMVMIAGMLIINRNAFKVKRKDLRYFFGTGILSVVFFNYCYFKTITMTSLSVAAVLLYTAPFFVIIMSNFTFHERITWHKIFAMLIAFLGCVFVTGAFSSATGLPVKGILVGLGAGFGYALYSIFGKYVAEKKYSSLTITMYTFIFASIGVIPFVKISHIYEILIVHKCTGMFAVLLIIITTVAPYIFYTVGLSGTQPGMAAVIASIEPVAATLLGVIMYGENLQMTTTIGMILVLLSIIWINIKKQ